MSLYQQYQQSSTITKVVSIMLLVGIAGALVCICGLGAWILAGGPDRQIDQETPAVAVATPIPPATAALPTPPPEIVEFTGWRGEYYDNPNLEGEPVIVRDDENIDFEWGCEPPAPRRAAHRFFRSLDY